MTDIDEIVRAHAADMRKANPSVHGLLTRESALIAKVRELQRPTNMVSAEEHDAVIATNKQLEKDKAGLVREVQRLDFDNNLLTEESAIRTDRAYINGLKEGWNFGISGNEKGYNVSVDSRQRMITESLNKHEHGGQI
jgi:hypothetical protein